MYYTISVLPFFLYTLIKEKLCRSKEEYVNGVRPLCGRIFLFFEKSPKAGTFSDGGLVTLVQIRA